MNDRKLLRVGGWDALAATLFCVTPVLVVALGAVGLSAAVGWLDYVLLPALAVFLGMVIYARVRRRRAKASEGAHGDVPLEFELQ